VVLAAHGYPDHPRRGDAIEGLARVTDTAHPDCKVFHAGTAKEGERVVVTGGRVLCVTALGDSVRQAQRAAYAAIGEIHFDGMQFRGDIGHRAIAQRAA
jgi:phosphoribosylamine--glycine ligase